MGPGIDAASLCSLAVRYDKRNRVGIDSWAVLKVYKHGLWGEKALGEARGDARALVESREGARALVE